MNEIGAGKLTTLEKEALELIERSGEVCTTQIPKRLMGVFPQLVNKGLIVIYKKHTSFISSKKKKFARMKFPYHCPNCGDLLVRREQWICRGCEERAERLEEKIKTGATLPIKWSWDSGEVTR